MVWTRLVVSIKVRVCHLLQLVLWAQNLICLLLCLLKLADQDVSLVNVFCSSTRCPILKVNHVERLPLNHVLSSATKDCTHWIELSELTMSLHWRKFLVLEGLTGLPFAKQRCLFNAQYAMHSRVASVVTLTKLGLLVPSESELIGHCSLLNWLEGLSQWGFTAPFVLREILGYPCWKRHFWLIVLLSRRLNAICRFSNRVSEQVLSRVGLIKLLEFSQLELRQRISLKTLIDILWVGLVTHMELHHSFNIRQIGRQLWDLLGLVD